METHIYILPFLDNSHFLLANDVTMDEMNKSIYYNRYEIKQCVTSVYYITRWTFWVSIYRVTSCWSFVNVSCLHRVIHTDYVRWWYMSMAFADIATIGATVFSLSITYYAYRVLATIAGSQAMYKTVLCGFVDKVTCIEGCVAEQSRHGVLSVYFGKLNIN